MRTSPEVLFSLQRWLREVGVARDWRVSPETIDYQALAGEVHRHLSVYCLSLWRPKTQQARREFFATHGVDADTVDFLAIALQHLVELDRRQLLHGPGTAVWQEDRAECAGVEELRLGKAVLPAAQPPVIARILENFLLEYPLVSQLPTNAACKQELYSYLESKAAFFQRDLPSSSSPTDLAHQTFVRILEKLGRYNYRAKFNTWCVTVMTNIVRDMVREQGRKQRCEVRLDGPAGGDAEEGASLHEILPDRGPDVETRYSQADQLVVLRRLIDQALAKSENLRRDRKIIDMLQDERTGKEIAQALGISPQTVYNLTNRLKKRLQELAH